MDRNVKSQVAFEFIILVAIAFVIMIVFVYSTRSDFRMIVSNEERELLKDVTYMVQGEINLASEMADGFYREFTIPATLENGDFYAINVTNRTIIALSENYEYVLNVVESEGQLVKGVNVIMKGEGVIYLNQ
ncbi:MAG: hypothetical protein ABIH76_07180 [Candidatus Bathyarchaeota archaeon]